jgi:hypothetical protein
MNTEVTVGKTVCAAERVDADGFNKREFWIGVLEFCIVIYVR